MGKLMRMAGRVLGAGVMVLAGAGVVVLAGAGVANARPASTGVCDKLYSTVRGLVALHVGYATNLKKDAPLVASQMTQAVSTGPAALKSAVSTYVADWEAGAAAGHLNAAKISADDDAIVAACAAAETAAPSGAPATGGGSAAGVRDPALFGLGGAAVLAGLGVLGLARRSRPRSSPGHG